MIHRHRGQERTQDRAAPGRIRPTTSGGAVHEAAVAPGGRPDQVVSAGW
ncbi:hypothetical protein [Streptomyces sp. NPDC051704]